MLCLAIYASSEFTLSNFLYVIVNQNVMYKRSVHLCTLKLKDEPQFGDDVWYYV
jgi:hypothetical protein